MALARAAGEGSGPAGHREAAPGPAARRARRRGAGAPAGRGGRRGGHRLPSRATPRSSTRGGPTTRWPPSWWRRSTCRSCSPAAWSPTSACSRRFERSGADAVMLARGSLGDPWRFERLLGLRDGAPTPRRGDRRARMGDRALRGAPRARPRQPLSAQVLSLVRGAAGPHARRQQNPLLTAERPTLRASLPALAGRTRGAA